jgi:RecA-family ATPase
MAYIPSIASPQEPVEADPQNRLTFLDLTSSHRPPARQWLVRDRIPLRQPTLFAGKGGGGKTITALQLCVATALDQDWLGMPAAPGHAIFIGAEDEADEFHRIVAAIADHYQVGTEALAHRLHVSSLAGRDAALAEHTRGGTKPTPLFDDLFEMACDIRPKVIVLDTASDVFGGDENDRTQVTAFVGLLRRLAIASNAAVIITAHPSQHGLSSGSGLSGSTAWHAKVRSQLYLKQAERGTGRELQFLKNNYGPTADSIQLTWRNGVFIPGNADDAVNHREVEAEADRVFLALLARLAGQNRNVSDKPGTTYAPSLFAKEIEGKALGKPALESSMLRLLTANTIKVQIDGPPSRQRSRLVLTEVET